MGGEDIVTFESFSALNPKRLSFDQFGLHGKTTTTFSNKTNAP
jgi:hypothetical protein